MNTKNQTRKIILIALFSAMAYVCMFVFRFKVSFLTFDAKDAIITVGAMLLGTIPGILMSFFVAFVELISVSDTGIYGFIMNFISSATFCAVASFVYRRRKSLNMALIALMLTVLSTTSVMLLANLLITPLYMTNTTSKDIVALILPLLMPFNFTKGLFNASLVLIIYKPITNALRKTKFIGDKANFKYNKNSIIILTLGIILLVASILIFANVLDGNFELIRKNI